MANWAYIENNQIKEVLDELPKNWKNVSNLDALESNVDTLKNLGWYPIFHNNVNYDPVTQKLKSLKIQFDGKKVFETYDIEDLPIDMLYEKFITELRIERDKLLKESDFMCLKDIINIKGQEWENDCIIYRQKLRDLPQKYPNVGVVYNTLNIEWPVKPNMKDYPKNNNSTNVSEFFNESILNTPEREI
jgi:hypothetical protein